MEVWSYLLLLHGLPFPETDNIIPFESNKMYLGWGGSKNIKLGMKAWMWRCGSQTLGLLLLHEEEGKRLFSILVEEPVE